MLQYIDGSIACVRRPTHFEPITAPSVVSFLISEGFKPIAANAIAYGALHQRDTTIALATQLKLLAK